MKNKYLKYLGLFLLLLVVGSYVTGVHSMAASATVELSSDSTEVVVGDTIYVYIRIGSAELFSDFEAYVSYNDDVLEYQGGASVITGSNGFLKISDINVTEAGTARKYTLKFEVLQVGICDISFSDGVMLYDEDQMPMSTSQNILTLNATAAETASTNANLQSLKTSPAVIAPEFDKNIFEYNVNVGHETDQLFITALPEDQKATVSISGNDFLKEGENKVIITVLAESGDVIEYTINVYREYASLEEDHTEEGNDVPDAALNLFEVIEMDGVKYVVYSGRYKLLDVNNEDLVPEGFIRTGMRISNREITVWYPEGKLESEFLLIYAMNEATGETGFYQYDKKEKTMQRYIAEDAPVYDEAAAADDMMEYMTAKQYQSNLNKTYVVIALLILLCGILTFAVIKMFLRLKGLKEDEFN